MNNGYPVFLNESKGLCLRQGIRSTARTAADYQKPIQCLKFMYSNSKWYITQNPPPPAKSLHLSRLATDPPNATTHNERFHRIEIDIYPFSGRNPQ